MPVSSDIDNKFLGFRRDDLEFCAKALLFTAPLLANAIVISWVIGMCLRFGIPMTMISVTPTQVLAVSVQGIIAAILLFGTPAFVTQLCVVSARNYCKAFNIGGPQKPKPKTAVKPISYDKSLALLFAFLSMAALFVAFLEGFILDRTADWAVVENTTTCVILLQMGDSYIAADAPGNGLTTPTFTIYRADKLPSFGMRRLGNLTGAREEPNTTPPRTTCPKVGDSDAKHP
jgi:hypothetical protein